MAVEAPQRRGSLSPHSPAGRSFQLSLLGSFRFREAGEARLALPGGSQRLLAFLALRDRAVERTAVAGTLWPEASEDRAHASLRSALSRLGKRTREAVAVSFLDLDLAEGVAVDIREAQALAHRLLEPAVSPEAADLSAAAVSALSTNLLPDWYDDWVLLEAEDWRQLRLHALEALAARLTADGRWGDAASAALAAVAAEPLRESARATLIRVHLAEGNQSEALTEFGRYRILLDAELGLEPTPLLGDLVSDLQQP
jgi:DNA-binding SARP family transcriptional activator